MARQTDLLMGYAEENLDFALDSHVSSTELLAHFNVWLKSQGNRDWAARLLASRIEAHDEFKAHNVVKAHIHPDERDHLSRPARRGTFWNSEVPAEYKAWRGIKFRDEYSESENARLFDV
jgi:hypothetical protein